MSSFVVIWNKSGKSIIDLDDIVIPTGSYIFGDAKICEEFPLLTYSKPNMLQKLKRVLSKWQRKIK